ncbi:indole-3-glycerol phosphate synthase 1 [Gemmatimonadetes bacterium T265]|nr:indole-3-glycerol phosphate synthase 1 [Gemmatimonadetes bacterium T265]
MPNSVALAADDRWTAPGGVLAELCAAARERVAALRPRAAELERAAAGRPLPPSFAGALRRDVVSVVAEIKRSSPSKGAIAPGLDAGDQAVAYARGGAAALSVLTEPTRFDGSIGDLDVAGTAVAGAVPLLRKDFVVDRLQLVEARAHGASAVLLIARALAPATLRELARDAVALGLDVLAEVRDERELDAALDAGAPVIGVNNRNLETLAIDLATGERLVPLIPADRVAVFESGVLGPQEVARAAAVGADAVLVGSSVSAAADPAAAVAALTRVARRARGRP